MVHPYPMVKFIPTRLNWPLAENTALFTTKVEVEAVPTSPSITYVPAEPPLFPSPSEVPKKLVPYVIILAHTAVPTAPIVPV